jgi:hypothetical protein
MENGVLQLVLLHLNTMNLKQVIGSKHFMRELVIIIMVK